MPNHYLHILQQHGFVVRVCLLTDLSASQVCQFGMKFKVVIYFSIYSIISQFQHLIQCLSSILNVSLSISTFLEVYLISYIHIYIYIYIYIYI